MLNGGEGLPTDYTFTGQKDVPGTGLMYYGARYYEPGLGRFVSADTIVPEPGNPQDLNRYTYVRNNPLAYTDPTGHYVYEGEPCVGRGCDYDPTSTRYHFSTSGGSASADTYFLSPTESRYIFGTAVAQRVSQGTVGAANDPGNVAMLYVGIAASLTGGLAGLPMPQFSTQYDIPADLYGDAIGDPGFGPERGSHAPPILNRTNGVPPQRTVGHHTIPRQILRGHLPPDVASDPHVRGTRGSPNVWQIPESLHQNIHRGLAGGPYNQRFIQELGTLGRLPTVSDVLEIRDALAVEFGFAHYRPGGPLQ